MTISAAYLGTETVETKVVSLHFEPAEPILGHKVAQNAYVYFATHTDFYGDETTSTQVSISGYFDPPRAHGWEMPGSDVPPAFRKRIIEAAKAVLP